MSDKVRDAFEAWHASIDPFAKYDRSIKRIEFDGCWANETDPSYDNPYMQIRWIAWQACVRALAQGGGA